MEDYAVPQVFIPPKTTDMAPPGYSDVVRDPDCDEKPATAIPVTSAGALGALTFESLSGVYQVLRKLGKGAFGTTYLVEREPGTRFALKEITCSSDKQRNVALQEVFLRTPPDQIGSNVCLVMTFCGGPTLESIILSRKEKNEPISEGQVNRWLRDLCQGLQAIHSAGLIHRDIKSDNILSHENGRLVIGDLGLLRSVNCPCKTFIAFKYYAAPEIFKEKRFSSASDMWALGCVLLEVMTGHLMRGREVTSLPSASPTIVEQELTRISKTNTYSVELLGLVSALLRHDPEQRPSAAQILRCGSCEMWESTGELRSGVTLSHNAGFFGAC